MVSSTPKSPGMARRLLSFFLNHRHPETVLADYDEMFYEVALEKSVVQAILWYWFQIIIIMPSLLKNSIYWSMTMFKNYMKIALRNIRKHKGYSFINITGLALGIACCIFILMWVQDELNFDRFHKNSDNIHRVVCYWEKNSWNPFEGTPAPLGPAIEAEIPEISDISRIATQSRKVFKYNDKVFYEDKGVIADPAFFRIFTFPFLKGDPETAFTKPLDVVITESFAEKYFGADDPMGKIMEVEGELATVTGVIEDIPTNSHLQFDFMSSFEFIKELSGYGQHWGAFNFATYILIREDSNPDEIGEKITQIALKNECPQVKKGVTMHLQHLFRIHLDSRPYQINVYAIGDAGLVYLFSAVALFVMLIACVNFMNLSTARSSIRAKEVGMRKTVGARRSQLIRQFFGESILLVMIAGLLALLLVGVFLPRFNHISGKQLSLRLDDYRFLASYISVIFFTGLISGSYPALLLSGFRPVSALRAVFQKGGKGASFRRILVVFQFSLSILLIIGTMVVYKQLYYIRNRELGFDKENVLFIPIKENIGAKYETVKNELLQNSDILSATAHWSPLTSTWRNAGWKWEGAEPERARDLDLVLSGVDFDFFETLNLEIIQGRVFSRSYGTDVRESVILNASAVKAMNLESPVGKWFDLSSDRRARIVGIVEDAHFQSLHQKIEERIYFINDMSDATDYGIVLMRIQGGRTAQAISAIRNVWERVNPISPFEFHFLDETYDRLYRKERRIGNVLNYFTFFAVFISCLGLFGLASFMAERRTKEIGIRKVVGARVSAIVVLLTKEFVRWVIVANVLAWPAGYFLSKKLLENYAYRVRIGPEVFILSSLAALMIALITVSFQAFRAARANPVDSLKYE